MNETVLQSIVEGTSSVIGEGFFRQLVKHMALALGVRYAFIAHMADERGFEAKTLALWNGEGFGDNFKYDIRHTPCENVVWKEMCLYEDNVAALFPEDGWLKANGIESYMAIPLFSPGGGFLGHMGVMDVKPLAAADNLFAVFKIFAARAAGELERERMEREQEQIFNLSLDPMCIADSQGRFKKVNPAFTKSLGFSEKEMIGQFFLRFIFPDDREAAARQAGTLLEGHITRDYEVRFLCKDGTHRWFSWQAAADREQGLIYATAHDITEAKKAGEELRAAKEAAEEATRLKDNFVSLVAHDLKSPFTSLLGLQRIMLNDNDTPLTPDHRDLVERMHQTSREMVAMIEELLDLSRLQTGKIRPEKRFIDAAHIAAWCVSNNRFAAEAKGLRLVNEVPHKTRIYADQRLFGEVLQNLVSNAVKFTPAEGFIRVFLPPGKKSVLAVEDSGTGISAKLLPDLFRLDVKTSTPGTGGERGTGLGLPYSMDIMKAHGGDLKIVSEPGRGTTVYAQLPHMRPRVLIVDDDNMVRQLISEIVRPLDVDVIYAENGVKALEAMERALPHLVISDIRMPEMDGFELLAKMRGDARLKSVPVITVTSDKDMKTRETAFQLGASDFITKPLEVEDLIPRANRFLEDTFPA